MTFCPRADLCSVTQVGNDVLQHFPVWPDSELPSQEPRRFILPCVPGTLSELKGPNVDSARKSFKTLGSLLYHSFSGFLL